MSDQPRRPEDRPPSINPKDWPRLTQTLRGPNRPGECRNCGMVDHGDLTLGLWQECDHEDKPEARYLWLCAKCSDQLVEPHVRLYLNPHKWAPAPGAMAICAPCQNRTGCLCVCKEAKANGGPGITITASKGLSGFWDVRDKRGRRVGGRFTEYPAPPSACSGFSSYFSAPPSQPAPAAEPSTPT